MKEGEETLDIHIDGASRGNPGEASFGIHVTDRRGKERAALYGYLGDSDPTTWNASAAINSPAEIAALL